MGINCFALEAAKQLPVMKQWFIESSFLNHALMVELVEWVSRLLTNGLILFERRRLI
jgi:hypothetical protein